MNLSSMAETRSRTPLSAERSRTTLRLRALMEKQQKIEIGERIRALREASPQTNASIAEHVGVGERAVANWISGGTGIQWANAKTVAELFDVDVNWLWTGRGHQPGPTPDPFSVAEGGPGEAAELAAFEQAAVRRHSQVMTELGKIRTLLEAQGTHGRRDARKVAGN